jgi:hypothetical protein
MIYSIHFVKCDEEEESPKNRFFISHSRVGKKIRNSLLPLGRVKCFPERDNWNLIAFFLLFLYRFVLLSEDSFAVKKQNQLITSTSHSTQLLFIVPIHKQFWHLANGQYIFFFSWFNAKQKPLFSSMLPCIKNSVHYF